MKSKTILWLFSLLCACSNDVTLPAGSDTVRVQDCVGPATSLAADLAAALPPRTGAYQPDDHYADLAGVVPGGFGGVFFDKGQPVLMLTRPAEAAEAKAALEGQLPNFPVANAEVRAARWDFLQLVDWFRYLFSQSSMHGLTNSADKNEVTNRLMFGVTNDEDRTKLVAVLTDIAIPCDLVQIVIEQPLTAATSRQISIAGSRPRPAVMSGHENISRPLGGTAARAERSEQHPTRR